MDKNERRICWYSTVLIVLLVNSPKLLALRPNGIIARYWHFNLAELLLQITFNFLFCWLLFEWSLNRRFKLSGYFKNKEFGLYFLFSILFLTGFLLITGSVQRCLFPDDQIARFYWLGQFSRLGLSGLLTIIFIKIILLLRDAKMKDLENEKLNNAYIAAELELLKEQMNPHFLFNALSSLTGVIRENPDLAQKYVRELSNVFRYAITPSKANLVTIDDELTVLRSFAQLITMRLENAFEFNINVGEEYLARRLPHLSLQPLIENAVKHNAATATRPLKVTVSIEDEHVVVCNTIWEIPVPESSNGLGLANLNGRFKIMMHREIEIIKTAEYFIVKLPLKE